MSEKGNTVHSIIWKSNKIKKGTWENDTLYVLNAHGGKDKFRMLSTTYNNTNIVLLKVIKNRNNHNITVKLC